MYCNCKDISSFVDSNYQKIFSILRDLLKESPKNEIPLLELIPKKSAIHHDQTEGGDVNYIQIATCTCEDLPLIRISEKCLGYTDEIISNIIVQVVTKISNRESGEYIVDCKSFELKKQK